MKWVALNSLLQMLRFPMCELAGYQARLRRLQNRRWVKLGVVGANPAAPCKSTVWWRRGYISSSAEILRRCRTCRWLGRDSATCREFWHGCHRPGLNHNEDAEIAAGASRPVAHRPEPGGPLCYDQIQNGVPEICFHIRGCSPDSSGTTLPLAGSALSRKDVP